MSTSSEDRRVERAGLVAPLAALALAVGLLAGLGWLVVRREGNLAWDDADYLRRGLQLSEIVSRRGLAGIPEAASRTLRERPKPPMLVAWIEAGGLVLGRRSLSGLIVFSSVVPFGLLLAGVVAVARRRRDIGSAPMAILLVAASPMMLSFGAKVMVETFLALWVLLAYDAASALLERPTMRRAVWLGTTLGLAAMTKLTVVLFLTAPAAYFLWAYGRRHGFDRAALRRAVGVALPALLIAGPWFLRNGSAAVRFARFSSKYQIVAEGRTDTVPVPDRLVALAETLAGWPLLATLALVGAVCIARLARRVAPEGVASGWRDFRALATIGAVSATAGLLVPAYFDPRFLLPIWPALAVATAATLRRAIAGTRARTALTYGLLALCVACSACTLLREPRTTTYWAAKGLIDELVARRGVRSLANVGNCPDWNVCKTGLINELRSRPRDCFVLHDLSKDGPEELRRRLARLDAVVVLDPAGLPVGLREAAPGLNRAYDAIGDALGRDRRFEQVSPGGVAGLPPLSIYVRRR